MKRQCQHTTPGGKQCKARAMARSRLCFFHDPNRASDRLNAQRAGGLRNRALSLSADTPDCDLKNAGDVIDLLGATINQVRRGHLDPRIANTIGYLSVTLLKAHEIGNLERRVSFLEIATRSQSHDGPRLVTEEFQFTQRSADDQPEKTDAN